MQPASAIGDMPIVTIRHAGASAPMPIRVKGAGTDGSDGLLATPTAN
jgi:hypothetical protein